MLSNVEEAAGESLALIQQVVDMLKSHFTRTAAKKQEEELQPPCLHTIEKLRSQARRCWDTTNAALQGSSPEWNIREKNAAEEVLEIQSNDSAEDSLESTLLMLMTSLWKCYQVLDRAPATPPLQQQQQQSDNNSKPKAPLGLLSLRHYTDICAIVEFICCWTILPMMDNDDSGNNMILLPIQDRIQYQLPKAIAGRMPSAALVWAANQQQQQPQRRKNRLWCTVGRLLLLDRFRPILLPRHLTDMYAALLWMRHFYSLHTTNTTLDDQETVRDLAELYGVWSKSPVCMVDAVAQARTYQQLLRCGTKAPAWLRDQVSLLLAQAAVRDLAATVAVFVDDDGASAVRLARALTASLDDDDNVVRNDLVQQMLHCLDAIPPATNDQVAKQTQYIIQTVWAVADGMADDRFVKMMMIQGKLTARSIEIVLHRMHCLWMFPPPQSPLPLKLLLATSVDYPSFECTFLRLLLRTLAAEAVLQSSAKELSKKIFQAVLAATSIEDSDALAFALLEAVTTSSLDTNFSIRTKGDSLVVEEKQEACDHIMAIADGIERRCTALCDILTSNSDRPAPLLPFLFRSLLSSYLSETSFDLPNFDLVPMVMLPMLCEKCTANQLLDEDSSILDLLRIVLANVLRRTSPNHELVDTLRSSIASETEEQRFLAATRRFSNLSRRQLHTSASGTIAGRVERSVDTDMLLGIVSILLALLTSILELGSSLQSVSGDNLDSLGDLLSLVAQNQATAASDDLLDTSALSEMASQAVALIHARKAGTIQSNVSNTVQEKLDEAKQSLMSAEPPLRARGIAILRNLAYGTSKNTQDETQQTDLLLFQILELSIQALADEESYVFLAAIHTIVVVVEIRPAKMIPILGFAHLNGYFDQQKLSNEQRIKLGEALVQIIRKRIGLLDELPRLLLLTVVGSATDSDGGTLSESQQLEAHKATHEFFINDGDNDNDDSLREREIRCRTGGPLFAGEENAVTVAERIHIVSELVAVVATSITADVCNSLVDAAISALTLEKERPLRRAGANLAYEVFRAVDRDEELDLAMALAASRLDILEATLRRIVLNQEIEFRLLDPATQARCHDALRVQEECHVRLLAGRLALEEKQKMDQHPIGRLLSPIEKVSPRQTLL